MEVVKQGGLCSQLLKNGIHWKLFDGHFDDAWCASMSLDLSVTPPPHPAPTLQI